MKVWLLSSICLLSAGVVAQSNDCIPSVSVSILAKKPIATTLLPVSEFTVKVDGRDIVPAKLGLTAPSRVFLMVDTSGSSKSKWDVITAAVREFYAGIPSTTSVTAVAFAEQGRRFDSGADLLEFLQTSQQDSQKKNALGNRTRMFDVLRKVMENENVTGTDTIVILSDAGDNLSSMTSHEAKSQLAALGTRIIFLYLWNPVPDSPEAQVGGIVAQDWANSTGGISFMLDSRKPGEPVLAPAVFEQVFHAYRIEFERSKAGKRLDIRVRKESPYAKSIEIHAPKRVPRCSID